MPLEQRTEETLWKWREIVPLSCHCGCSGQWTCHSEEKERYHLRKQNLRTRECNNGGLLLQTKEQTTIYRTFISDSCETSIIQRTAYKIIGQKLSRTNIKCSENRIALYVSWDKSSSNARKLILCENYRPHTKNKIFFFNNNKKQPAYIQDNNIFYESGLPKFPVKLYLLQFSQ